MSDYEKIKLKNGETRYRKFVSLGTVAGKRKATRITAKTLKELRQKEAELQLNIKNVVSNKSMSLLQAYDLYLSQCRKTQSKATIAQKVTVRNKITAIDMPIKKLNVATIKLFFEGMSDLSDSAISAYENVFDTFLHWCVKKELIDSDPMSSYDKHKRDRREMTFLTESEFWKMWKYAYDQYKLALIVLFYTGLRKSELCGLKRSDLINGEIHIQRTVVAGSVRENKFKTKNAKRIVPVPGFLIYDLEHVLRDDVLVFKTFYTDLNYETARLVSLKVVKPFRVHDLRHSYAAMMINKGADIYTLSRVMGHGSITITTDTYGHLYDDKRRALMQLFD